MARKVASDAQRVKYTVTLNCNHELLFSNPVPVKGEDIWCVRCNRETIVIDSIANFRLECQTCSFARQYGRGRLTAERAAVRHRYRNGQHHIIDLYDGLTFVYRFATHPRQLLLDSVVRDQIPF